MPIMNRVKEGSDLGHPKPSIGWAVGAIVSVIMLLLVFTIGSMLFGKASRITGIAQSGAETIVSTVAGYGSGYD